MGDYFMYMSGLSSELVINLELSSDFFSPKLQKGTSLISQSIFLFLLAI